MFREAAVLEEGQGIFHTFDFYGLGGSTSPLGEITRGRSIGLDIAKHVFQVHGIDASVNMGLRRRLMLHEVLTFFATCAPPTGIEMLTIRTESC